MKNRFTVFCITFCLVFPSQKSFSQIINIPDQYFKQTLIEMGFDLNQDNNIQISEALQIDKLNFDNSHSEKKIKSLEGIKEFKNLKYLNVTYLDSLKKIDLSGMSKIESIFNICSWETTKTELDTILLDSCQNLKNILLCDATNVIPFPKLEYVSLLGCINLEGLNFLSLGKLKTLSLINLYKLKDVELESCIKLQELTITNCPNIKWLNISNTFLGITGNYKVNTILRQVHLLESLAVGGILTNDYTENIDFSLIPLLSNFTGHSSKMTEVDISSCKNLRYFDIEYNPELVYLNIKNGIFDSIPIYIDYEEKLEKFCCDKDEYLFFKNDLMINGGNVMILDSVCKTTGINDIENKPTFQIFPNPTQGKLNIQGKNLGNENQSIQILDALGSIVYRNDHIHFSGNETIQIDLNLDNGNYWLQLSDGQNIKTLPFIFIK